MIRRTTVTASTMITMILIAAMATVGQAGQMHENVLTQQQMAVPTANAKA